MRLVKPSVLIFAAHHDQLQIERTVAEALRQGSHDGRTFPAKQHQTGGQPRMQSQRLTLRLDIHFLRLIKLRTKNHSTRS